MQPFRLYDASSPAIPAAWGISWDQIELPASEWRFADIYNLTYIPNSENDDLSFLHLIQTNF
jgi:hypothetical protein